MKVWKSMEVLVPQKIEFVTYAPEDCEEVLQLITEGFYRIETVSRSTKICENPEALKEMLEFCKNLLKKTKLAIVARDVEKNQIVGFSFNFIQEKPIPSQPGAFEIFAGNCKTANAKCFNEYLLASESKFDKFELYKVNAVLEVTDLVVLPEYSGKGIATNLVRASVQLATDLKNGIKCDELLFPGQPRPELVTAIWSVRGTQKIGQKLGFEVFFEEPFTHYSFEGKTFAEHVGDPTLTSQLVAKRI